MPIERPQYTFGRCLRVLLVLCAGGFAGGCASMSGGGAADADHGQAAAPAKTTGANSQNGSAADVVKIEPTVVGYKNYSDPLIKMNRAVFAFNDVLYRYLFIPVGKGYMYITPAPVRRGVSNFFYNIKTPIYAVNHLLQFKLKPLGRDLLRFGINTTIGLLGIFDPAQSWFHIEREETHFDDTLRGYGAGHGVYLVLPVFGPSDVRNSVSVVTDYILNPIPYLTQPPQSTEIQSFDYLQDFAPNADRYTKLREKSDDPYIFFRNLYLQGVKRDEDY